MTTSLTARWRPFVPTGLVALLALLVAPAHGAIEEQVEITLSAGGVRPKLVRLRKGEAARLVLRSADREHCFAVDELRIERRVKAGGSSVVDVLPERAGRFDFYSCLDPDDATARGQIVVSE
jgi:heme/copper-type cytochrome/quinol oxidase subunit 2